ncbi:MAG: gas vesicle protein GvpN [Leptolyngbyaceae bacterium]|nr:gas vesicle protein GvpN [Leptolyngbyaceae bacterium]
MTTTIQARPRQFVHTPAVDRVAKRALRYLQSGYSVHLRGPAGVGKTTLALHLADLLSRPIMLLFGDDEFKTSDLIGNQSGFTRKKVFDNFIHSVVKMEDEVRQNWVDSRLTLACREGFTLVYDEFNRSRPEVNNVLLSALEEKLLVLPPNNSRSEYIRVNPHFRAIFTSNPVEYCGVHSTQDALLDRLITINMPEPDELTQNEILVQKTEIDRESAGLIVQLVSAFRHQTSAKDSSGLRSCLMIAKICKEHGILASPGDADFRELCQDILLSRASQSLAESTQILWNTFNRYTQGSHFLANEAQDAGETPEAHSIEQFIDQADDVLTSEETQEQLADQPIVLTVDPLTVQQPQAEVSDTHGVPEDEAIALSTTSEPVAPTPEPIASERSIVTERIESEEPAPSDYPNFLHALEVNVSQVAQEIAMQFESLSEQSDETEDFPTNDDFEQSLEESPSRDGAIADGRIASVTFAPGEDISGLDDTDQALADTLEAPYQELPGDEVSEDDEPQHDVTQSDSSETDAPEGGAPIDSGVPFEQEVYQYLQTSNDTRPSQIESALGISRFQTVNALRSLAERGLINLHGNHAPRMRSMTQPDSPSQPHLSSNFHPNSMANPSIPAASSPHMGFRPQMTGGDFA